MYVLAGTGTVYTNDQNRVIEDRTPWGGPIRVNRSVARTKSASEVSDKLYSSGETVVLVSPSEQTQRMPGKNRVIKVEVMSGRDFYFAKQQEIKEAKKYANKKREIINSYHRRLGVIDNCIGYSPYI